MNQPARNAAIGAEQGFTMIETMFASVVFAVGVLALVSAISSATVVDAINVENDCALDAARQVMEQVKSASFDSLATKVQYFEDNGLEDALDYVPPPTTTDPYWMYHTDEGNGNYYEAKYTLQGDANYAGTFCAESDPEITATDAITDWYGTSILKNGTSDSIDHDPHDNLYKQASVVIDCYGNFLVHSPKIGGLTPWNEFCALTPTPGRVRVRRAWRDADGDGLRAADGSEDLEDVIEITVTVRWNGRQGPSQKILRCEVADWEAE